MVRYQWDLYDGNLFRICRVRTARDIATFPERFVNLDTFLRNCAIAGALHHAYVTGRVDGTKDGQFLQRAIGDP